MTDLMSPSTLLAIIITISFCLLALIGLLAMKMDRRVKSDNQKHAEQVVKDIFEQCGWESRQRWIDNKTIEFVYLALGKHIPGEHLIWVCVRIEKKAMYVVVEYYNQIHHSMIPFAEEIVEEFRRRNIPTRLERVFAQPTEEETGTAP